MKLVSYVLEVKEKVLTAELYASASRSLKTRQQKGRLKCWAFRCKMRMSNRICRRQNLLKDTVTLPAFPTTRKGAQWEQVREMRVRTSMRFARA